MKMTWRNASWMAAAVLLAGLLVYGLQPVPAEVDTATVSAGPMTVTADEQGEARNHDRYVVSAPVAGKVQRIVLHDGDAVHEGQTVAEIAPLPLGTRERDEQVARVQSAGELAREALERLHHAQADLAQAGREQARIEDLFRKGFVPAQSVEQAANAVTTAGNEAAAAAFRSRAAQADVVAARAGLVAVSGKRSATLVLRAPVSGRVLQIPDTSERVVPAGTPLMVLGDMQHMEVMAEFLSSEAVNIRPGMPVLLDGWGGNRALHAHVRLVEPYAFTKVSALGVEEKRTRVIADFDEDYRPLGDGFRVNAHVVLWSSPRVLRVPASALFRCDAQWCVFVVAGHRARRQVVQVGQRNPSVAEVLGGLGQDAEVILYPDNSITEGTRLSARKRR